MMTEEQLIAKFLELQDQSEQMTDEQLHQALDDEQMRELSAQMAFTKRAFINETMQANMPSVEEEWEKFDAHHSEQSDTRNSIYKMVASFVGVLFLVSGITFAAIHIMSSTHAPETPTLQVEHPTQAQPTTSPLSDNVLTEPYIFDNITLEKMLTEIAAAHHVSVKFQNKDARQLRFHFVWKREDSLNRTIERLNTFEAVDIIIENEKLIVR